MFVILKYCFIKGLKMNYNIIFFDVDGTLINYEDGCVEESTKQAIQLLQERGIHLEQLQEDLYRCVRRYKRWELKPL